MHKLFQYNHIKPGVVLIVTLFFFAQRPLAQYITVNGACFSLNGNVAMNADTIENINSSVINNNGSINLQKIINAATVQGDGIYNISKAISNSGTFIPGASTVNYNGAGIQILTALNYNNLTVTQNGTRTVTLDNTGPIGIAGTFTPDLVSTSYIITGSQVNYNGNGNQTITGFNYINLSATGGSTKTAGGNISIQDSLKIGDNTAFSLGNFDITLKSTSTYNARIATLPSTASINYGTGRFTVERYVMGRRKYRLFTSSVTSSDNATLTTGEEALSIWGNWQNSGNNVTQNIGTIITGGLNADGFDTQTTTASMYNYDEVNRVFTAHSTANGKNTKYTPLKAGKAFYLFVYGDRTNTITTSNPKFTTISSKGKVLVGDQLYTTVSANPLNPTTNKYAMLGNPFASPINWANVTRSNISNTFWGWDPNLNSTGGYVTVTSTGTVTLIAPFSGTVGLNQYIQPGQGFFVKTTGASPTMTIKESDKVANYNSIAFFNEPEPSQLINNIPLLAVNLQYPSGPNMLLADGSISAFDNSFSNTVGTEDATKLMASTEVMAIQNGADLLSVDARKMPVNNDTIYLNMQRITKPQYTLQIFANQMTTSTLSPFLIDNYLNTTQALSLTDTNRIVFTVTGGVPASSAANRFKIVFRDFTVLPVVFRSIKASQKQKDVQVDWSVAEESSTVKYQVEHSTNGLSFIFAGEVSARGIAGNQDYQWLHTQAVTGINYYRVKAINADGKFVLSSIVQLKMDMPGNAEPQLSVYPNPVEDYQINLQLSNFPIGKYPMQLVNTQGQVVYSQLINYSGGSMNKNISLSRLITPGIYYLIILVDKIKYSRRIFIE